MNIKNKKISICYILIIVLVSSVLIGATPVKTAFASEDKMYDHTVSDEAISSGGLDEYVINNEKIESISKEAIKNIDFIKNNTSWVNDSDYSGSKTKLKMTNNSINKMSALADLVESETVLQNKINTAPNNIETIIELIGNINVTKTLNIPADKNIKLVGKYTLKRETSFTDDFMITNNGTLTLDGITIDGSDIPTPNHSGIINKKNLTLNSGIIQNSKSTIKIGGVGGGIHNTGSSAVFTMNGGTIKNNDGEAGGVKVHGGSKMIMHGGTIEFNSGEWGGGICLAGTNDNLTLYAGTIKNNKAKNLGGGIYTHYKSVFTAYNVLINNNSARNQGGGLWVCEQGGGKVSNLDGLACFDNTASVSGDDFYKKSAEISTSVIDLSNKMIAGAETTWYKDGPSDAERYINNKVVETVLTDIRYVTALKSVPEDTSKLLARKNAATIITDNVGFNGGGFANNGAMQLGLRNVPQKISINVSKKWENDDGEENKRPINVKIQLLKKGVKIGGTIDLNTGNQWSHTFTDLDLENNDLPQDYTIEEVTVPGYEPSVGNLINIDGSGNYKLTLTNTKSVQPSISTKAKDEATKTSKGAVGTDGSITLTDSVNYENLNTTKYYKLIGTLMINDGSAEGKPLLVDGKNVTTSAAFKPSSSSGTQEITFTFDGSELNDNTTLVVFEKLFLSDNLNDPIAIHENINDKDQTVAYEHKKKVNVKKVWNIPSGYQITTPDSIELELYLNGQKTNRKVRLDANSNWLGEFENISYESEVSIKETTVLNDYDTKYSTEAGLNEDVVYVTENTYKNPTDPRIITEASDNVTNKNEGFIDDGMATIVDKVIYKNFNINKEYTVIGTLMVKDGKINGSPLFSKGNPVTSSAVFKPDTASGHIYLLFKFDASQLKDETSLVVYEKLYEEGNLNDPLTVHEDINNEKQTVKYKHDKDTEGEDKDILPYDDSGDSIDKYTPEKKYSDKVFNNNAKKNKIMTNSQPKTSDSMNLTHFLILVLILAAVIIILIMKRIE